MSSSSGGSTFVWQDTGAVIAGPTNYNSKTANSFTVTVTLPIGHKFAIKAEGATLPVASSTLTVCAGTTNCLYQTNAAVSLATYTVTVEGAVGDIVLTAISSNNRWNRNFKTYSVTVPDVNPDRWNADSSQLDKYSGVTTWTGDAVKVGKLSLTWLGTQVGIEFRNLVADPDCRSLGVDLTSTPPPANSCGLHVHSGRCSGPPGGHWYKAATVPSDPWTAVSYITQDGYLLVDTGYTWAESHKVSSVVVHNRAGTRMACIDVDRTFVVNLPTGFASPVGAAVAISAVLPYPTVANKDAIPVVGSLQVSFDGLDTMVSFVDLDIALVVVHCSVASTKAMSRSTKETMVSRPSKET